MHIYILLLLLMCYYWFSLISFRIVEFPLSNFTYRLPFDFAWNITETRIQDLCLFFDIAQHFAQLFVFNFLRSLLRNIYIYIIPESLVHYTSIFESKIWIICQLKVLQNFIMYSTYNKTQCFILQFLLSDEISCWSCSWL